MKGNARLLWAVVAMLVASSLDAYAAPTAQEAIASRQYLIGTWNCVHTYGTHSGTYTTVYQRVLGNLWITQTYDFHASKTTPAMQAEFIMGYDESRHTWIRFGALSSGDYFALRMTDTSPTTTVWKYVSFFPPQTAQTSQSSDVDATFTKKSDTEYEVVGPTYKLNGNGPTVTEHHICRKD